MSGHQRGQDQLHLQGGYDEEEEEIYFGIRQSRRATSYQYRDSSSLTPVQIMQQEVHYQQAEDALEQSLIIAHGIALLIAVYNHYNSVVNRWCITIGSRHDIFLERAIVAVHAKIQWFKNEIDRFLLLLTWTRAYRDCYATC